MPTVKIAEILNPCSHPEHILPLGAQLESGVYRHTCPECGHTYTFTFFNPNPEKS